MKTFEYDHELDGVYIHIRGEETVHLTGDDLCNLIKCLHVDRIREVVASNQDVSKWLSMLADVKVCKSCNGKGMTGGMFDDG